VLWCYSSAWWGLSRRPYVQAYSQARQQFSLERMDQECPSPCTRTHLAGNVLMTRPREHRRKDDPHLHSRYRRIFPQKRHRPAAAQLRGRRVRPWRGAMFRVSRGEGPGRRRDGWVCISFVSSEFIVSRPVTVPPWIGGDWSRGVDGSVKRRHEQECVEERAKC